MSQPPPPPPPAYAAKIVVRIERKGRGGKTVTIVEGIRAHTEALELITKELKNALGCGGTTEGTTIVLQGELSPRVKVWLEKKGATKVVLGN